jgi:hypothetical protein
MRHAVLACVLATSVLAQPAAPQTPAGTVLTAWVTAFNSADPAVTRAFDETYRPAPPLGQLDPGLRQQTGGFTLLRLDKSEPTSIVAVLQEKNSDRVSRIEFVVGAEDPPKILRQTLRPIPRPADLQVQRMTEADALAALSAQAGELANHDQFSGAVLVARHGKVLLHKVWGHANREAGTPVTSNSQFRIGSMNKMNGDLRVFPELAFVVAALSNLDPPAASRVVDFFTLRMPATR